MNATPEALAPYLPQLLMVTVAVVAGAMVLWWVSHLRWGDGRGRGVRPRDGGELLLLILLLVCAAAAVVLVVLLFASPAPFDLFGSAPDCSNCTRGF